MMKLTKDSLLCIKDLTHDHFWKGGNSWGIDSCPECGGMETILYKNLSLVKKVAATLKFNRMWKNKHRKI